MRLLALLLVAAVCVPALWAQAGAGRSPAVTVQAALPEAFAAGDASSPAPGLTIQTFADVETQRHVVATIYTEMPALRRLTFRHGLGISRSTPHAYDRVPVASLPVTSGLAASAQSAFLASDEDGRQVGVVVRGCIDGVCYQLAAQGPRTASAPTGLAFAHLLQDVRLRDAR